MCNARDVAGDVMRRSNMYTAFSSERHSSKNKGRDPETLRNSSNVSIKYLYIYDVMFDGNIYRRHLNLTPYVNAGFYNKKMIRCAMKLS